MPGLGASSCSPQGSQTHGNKQVVLERECGQMRPGARSRRQPADAGITLWKPAPGKLLFTHQAAHSLEEVEAGSGFTRVVSETAQMFWGKLERGWML